MLQRTAVITLRPNGVRRNCSAASVAVEQGLAEFSFERLMWSMSEEMWMPSASVAFGRWVANGFGVAVQALPCVRAGDRGT